MSASLDALATLRGEQRGQNFLICLRGICGDGDELLRLVKSCPQDELRGLCRLLQKTIERAAR